MVDFKKDTWLYALIAFIILVVAIFTPWGSIDQNLGLGTGTFYSWFSSVIYAGDPYDMWIGAGVTTWCLGISAFCAALFLFYGLNSWRGKDFKWDWLVYLLAGIALIVFPILALALESTEGGIIGFAPIGMIIAGAVAIVAFIMDKFMGRGGAA